MLKGWPEGKKRVRLSEQFKFDLFWWRDFAAYFNRKNLMVRYNYGSGSAFYMDSCLLGYGLCADKYWQAGFFNDFTAANKEMLNIDHGHWVNVHVEDQSLATNINVLELIPVWLCI